jgi:hypothetical protein
MLRISSSVTNVAGVLFPFPLIDHSFPMQTLILFLSFESSGCVVGLACFAPIFVCVFENLGQWCGCLLTETFSFAFVFHK